ncbi:MAG: uroporphyrinogen decarboxylase family protein [Anaerolineae bacterium]
MMTHRERVLTAFSHRVPDLVPRELYMSPAVKAAVQQAVGNDDLVGALGLDMSWERLIGRGPSAHPADYTDYFSSFPEGASYSEWGEMWYPSGFHHFSGQKKPMAKFTSVKEIEAYPFPDTDAEYRYAEVSAKVASMVASGYPAISSYECGFFEQAHALRGMDNILIDLKVNPDFVHALLDQIAVRKIGSAVQFAKAGVDVVFVGDDWGHEKGLFMSPDTWREYFKPFLRQLVSRVRAVRSDVIIAYHSCGYIEPLLPELIDSGIDVWHSVQPEANDLTTVKQRYGRDLAFWGTVGVQSTFPHSTPEEMERVVRHRIATVGRGGGLLIAPAHVIEPETPVENVLAFIAAVDKYGLYQ